MARRGRVATLELGGVEPERGGDALTSRELRAREGREASEGPSILEASRELRDLFRGRPIGAPIGELEARAPTVEGRLRGLLCEGQRQGDGARRQERGRRALEDLEAEAAR